MKKPTTLLLSILVTLVAFSQVAPDKYHIRFTDKNNSPYSINNPLAFLSQRAIDRRANQNIPIVENDLPVNPDYIDSISSTGVTILNVSKWMNSLTVFTTDQNALNTINAFPFVQSVSKSSSIKPISQTEKSSKPFFENESFGEFSKSEGQSSGKGIQSVYDYGSALNQIQMLNGDSLHDMGYDGAGMIIAVLDAGFLNVNSLSVFDSLWTNGQILGSRDFVNPQNPNIYGSHSHGCMVLSTMGGNIPGEMVGTAPQADYWLIRTEDAATEYLIEELNWVSGAEFADSLGADVINSSLGYTTFDDPNHNHTYEDMDGNTAPITIGADIAASKGILVCNSAGNSGNNSWHYIGAPADGDSVFSIGAVNGSGVYTYFSSTGPTYDGRIKPNVVAKGQGTTIVNPWNGAISTGNGTSFSSPVTAGMVTCLWQANPTKSNIEIMEAVQQSASQANSPDSLLGFGIPNYMLANRILAPVIHEISLDVKVILEGAYNGTNMNSSTSLGMPLNQPYNNPPFNYPGDESVTEIPSGVVDWVLVELRDAASPATATEAKTIEREAAFLKTDGSITGLDGISNLQFNLPVSDSLYVVVFHRNHLSIISNFGLTESAGTYPYDFTTDATKAFGVNAQNDLGSGVFGMLSGDANADGSVDGLDKSGSWSTETGLSGYLSSDLDLDGESNNVDKNDYWQVNEGSNSQVPE